jgi:hypothetical protein
VAIWEVPHKREVGRRSPGQPPDNPYWFEECELPTLVYQEQVSLEMRSGMRGGRIATYDEIGEELGIKGEWVRQILNRVLVHLRNQRQAERHASYKRLSRLEPIPGKLKTDFSDIRYWLDAGIDQPWLFPDAEHRRNEPARAAFPDIFVLMEKGEKKHLSPGEWADRIAAEAKVRELSTAQIHAFDSIARCALESIGEEEMWKRAIRLSGATPATLEALERKGFIVDGEATEEAQQLAKEAYAIVSERDWQEDTAIAVNTNTRGT